MFSALWNAAAMLTGSRESWHSTSSNESSPTDQKPARTSSNRDWHGPEHPEWHGDAGFSEDADISLQWAGSGTGNNKLFLQLLDDLDGLTSNTDSAHRRRRARELMSDYIFRPDLQMQVHSDCMYRGHPMRRSNAAEYGLRRPELEAARNERALRRSSGDFSGIQLPNMRVSPEHRAVRCRSGDFSSVDILVSPKPSPQHVGRQRGHLDRMQWQSHPPFISTKENEDDSGYHTGNSQLLCTKRAPGPRTLSREDCRRRIALFNDNHQGLVMTPPEGDCDTFQGAIRVHMNLVRPINMCISLPSTTLYDIHHMNESPDSDAQHVQMTSFYLPKETSKVIHISSTTTTQEVIRVLLSKFHITDNPRKFALYEKTQEVGKAVVVRRIGDDEMPLQICLGWTDDGSDNLDRNQFVLQDYDTGEILWEAFSLPELESFLAVLNREEVEYIEQVKTKFRLMKVQMVKKMKELESKTNAVCSGKRKPVFV